MNIDFQFSTEYEYFLVWKYKPNKSGNIFGSKIKIEYEYDYIRFENINRIRKQILLFVFQITKYK